MSNTPSRPGCWSILWTWLAVLFVTGGTGFTQDRLPFDDEPVVRGQSPYGTRSLPPEPIVPFGTSVSPWITASHATINPPRIAQNPADPFSAPPYGGTPTYGVPGTGGIFLETPPVWHPYAAAQGLFGNNDILGVSQLVIPLYQDGTSMLFSDIRGRIDDDQNYEGNFGLGHRTIVDNMWIFGFNGFFDLRKTREGSDFQQVGMGIEALSVQYEARANGYIPINDSNLVAGPITADVIGNSIFLVGNEQRAYYGVDGEVGALVWDDGFGGNELRAFVGGYYFDTNKDNFPSIAGPKGRLELRSYNLPMLGPESRLTLGVEAQWDNVQDFQVAGLARVEIPLGYGRSRPLSRLERRMLDRIVRDDDIITNIERTPRELGRDSDTGRLLNNVLVVNANTANIPSLVTSANPVNGTVIVDGTAGTVTVDGSQGNIVLQDGQVFRGGGFNVVGVNTGTTVNFGTRPTINITSADPAIDGVNITNNTQVWGIDFTGGAGGSITNSVAGFPALTNVVIRNNTMTGAAQGGLVIGGIDATSVVSGNTATGSTGGDGFMFLGDVAGTVSNNISTGNALDGFNVAGDGGAQLGVLSGTMSGNTATGNGTNGIRTAGDVSGTITGNTTSNNGAGGVGSGMNLFSLSGTVSNNTADTNATDGFTIGAVAATGQVTGNSATGNARSGFNFTSTLAGTVANNTAANNGDNGIRVGSNVLATGSIANNQVTGSGTNGGFSGIFVSNNLQGQITGNTVTNGLFNGIRVNGNVVAGGSIANNQTTGNAEHGIAVDGSMAGTISGNTSTANAVNGIFAGGDVSGTITGNTTNGNGTGGTGSGMNLFSLSGTLSNNTANNNATDGFRMGSIAGIGLVTGNTANGNTGNGFNVTGAMAGTLSGNTANANLANGFRVGGAMTGNVTGNTATANLGTTTPGDASGNGFLFASTMSGVVSGNLSSLNQDDGYDFVGAVSGLISSNIATNNGQNPGGSANADGFQFTGNFTGTLDSNQSTGNRDDGFFLGGAATNGTISNNISNGNGSDGFVLLNVTGGTVLTNAASGNASDGFEIGSTADGGVAGVWNGGSLFFNNATNNTLFGFRVNNRTAFPATTAFGNAASGNGNNTLPTVP